MKILNLYAGIGGNRKLWNGVDVTAVENNKSIAAIYKASQGLVNNMLLAMHYEIAATSALKRNELRQKETGKQTGGKDQ